MTLTHWHFSSIQKKVLLYATTYGFTKTRREIALSHFKQHGKALRKVFPLVIKDFGKILFGLIVSIALAFAVGSLAGL